MSSKKKHEKLFLFCPECGISISHRRILNKGEVRLRYVFCTECGKKIDFANYMTETSINVKSTDKKDFEDNLDNALDIIINDRDFSQSFKNILHRFIARLSYVKLKEVEKEKNTPTSQMLLTTELIDLIEDRLVPIMNRKPILSVLKYLDQSDYPEFFLDLKRYQIKHRKNKKYRKAYSIYVRWLIGIIYRILNQINIENGLYEYQKIIRDDLVKFFELEKNYEEKSKDNEMTNNLEKIKKKIREIDWKNFSDDWVVEKFINKFTKLTKLIKLNPYKDCDKDSNPLYMHKGWLRRLYYELDLSDQEIAEICGMTRRPIVNWRKRLNIDTKEEKGYVIDNHGYKMLLMPLDYKHPQRKPTKSGRQKISEQRIVIENYLRQNPYSEASKRYLIDGKYLRSGTEVHHINKDRLDNRIENLWLFSSKKIHQLTLRSLNQCLSALIKLGQIIFYKGEYKIDNSFDYRVRCNKEEIQDIAKPVEFKIPFEDIEDIKSEIKQWDWYKFSQDWIVKKQYDGLIKLNPFEDCDEFLNPLYMHKIWMEKIINTRKFNMNDSRLGELCGVSFNKIYYWRWKVHKISIQGRTGIPKHFWDGYIWIIIPDDYKNPFAKTYRNQKTLKEHRYIAERFLADSNSPFKNEYLYDRKYLKRDCSVHHINLDKLDNRIENLYITIKHSKLHNSLRSQVKQLLNTGFLNFNNGKYFLN